MDEQRLPDIDDPKDLWRSWATTMDRSGASHAVAAQLEAWPPLHGVVATYLPMRSEISLDGLLSSARITPVVPRVEQSGVMSMRAYDPDHLVHHRLGFDEPDDGSQVVDAADIDVVLVPGLAFDGRGGRLGRGMGYYDRFLASVPRSVARVGVTSDGSVVDAVPMDTHDQRLGWLATESGVRWVGPHLSPDTARFMEHAISVGIAPNIERFPSGTRTSEDAARAVGCELGAIAKSIVFDVDGAPVLVICPGDRRVDEAKLAHHFHAARARPHSRNSVHGLTGFPAGGTPAVGHDTPLPTIVDAALGRYRRVWSAGGSLDTVYEMTLERLVASSGARWADVSTEAGT